jgi:SAM-dependent methyltransferase
LNLPHYPATVASLVALEPATLLPKRVALRVAAAPVLVTIVAGEAENLPFAGRRFDCVVSTWTLCTIPDVAAALREVGRVLKPGGRFTFLEHGRSDSPLIAAWQDRLNPLQRRLACGCNLNRPIDRLIAEAGLRLAHLDRFRMPGVPRIGGEMYRGVAVSPSG